MFTDIASNIGGILLIVVVLFCLVGGIYGFLRGGEN